ncbi:MAG TPA: hypothetical protein VK826_02980 [Bacteroidia bacterium]|nr:hypothetical protein [Bacteroidia bacterium]
MTIKMTQAEQLVRKIEFAESIVGIRKDGILHVYIKPHVEITPEYQDKQLLALIDLSGGTKHPAIYEAAEYVTVGSDARNHAAALEEKTPTLCKVVFVTNLAHKIIAEFYFKFNKPKQPYKVFSNFQEGIDWLIKTRDELRK